MTSHSLPTTVLRAILEKSGMHVAMQKKGTVFKKHGKASQQCHVVVRSLLGQEYSVFDKWLVIVYHLRQMQSKRLCFLPQLSSAAG